MELLVERAAALDVGKDEVVACVRVPGPGGRGRRQEIRTFATFTATLEALAEWLAAQGVTQVVMEATGQYWKPCWYVLEQRGFALLLVNAHHVKILPGRKTDVGDAAWLCELLECGLLRGSFVPPPAIRQLRDLTRYRKRLIQAHSAECQRIQKTLEDAGIKLDSVAADILGVSGRAMLKALVAGERDPGVLGFPRFLGGLVIWRRQVKPGCQRTPYGSTPPRTRQGCASQAGVGCGGGCTSRR